MSTITHHEPEGAEVDALIRTYTKQVQRIGDSLHTGKGPQPLSLVRLDFFDCSVANLGQVIASPYASEIVDQRCHHCEAILQCRRIVAPFVACDDCIARKEKEEKLERYKRFWEHTCPERFRNTDTTFKATKPEEHDFPKAIYDSIRKDDGDVGQSFFLIGPTGTCKTRVGMKLLKRALLRDQHVGVLWPEKIAGLKSDFNDLGTFDKYAAYDVLLFDDSLLTACRNSRHMDAIKQLLDVRMRHNRPSIFTSQIGEAGVKSGKEFGELKEADVERIDAVIRRLRQECKVVQFSEAVPKDNEQPF